MEAPKREKSLLLRLAIWLGLVPERPLAGTSQAADELVERSEDGRTDLDVAVYIQRRQRALERGAPSTAEALGRAFGSKGRSDYHLLDPHERAAVDFWLASNHVGPTRLDLDEVRG